MKDFPVRKYLRLRGYDYSSNGAYFITFCVRDRHEMLGRIVGRDALGAPSVELSDYGNIVNNEIKETPAYYEDVFVDKYVVMPNHVHIIICVDRIDGAPRASRHTAALIPSVISMIKKKTNKKFGFDMWQTSYHDHIIRDEAEHQRICQYIDENPARWAEDEYCG